MRRTVVVLSSVIVLAVIAIAAAKPSATDVERGKYLVRDVAMCVQCHTPRTDEGAMIEARMLQGAPMPVASPFANQSWAPQAPMIAGLPGGWSADDLAHFLETGISPSGEYARNPMPPFRMTRDDATAVAAYLQSLPPR